jgi:hypothetical protein
MKAANEPLAENEVGPFGELSGRPNPQGLAILTVPSFEAMLPFIERRLGRKLSPQEMEAERLKAPSIVVSQDAARKMAAARAARLDGAK